MLERLLDTQVAKTEYFEQLILTRSGFITDKEAVVGDVVDFPSIHRMSTMSALRKQAADLAKVAHNRDKTAAESKFEEELANINQG